MISCCWKKELLKFELRTSDFTFFLHIQIMGIFQRPLKRLILICDFLLLKKNTFEVRAPNFRFYFFSRNFLSVVFFSTIVFWTNDYVSETFIVGFFPFDVFCKTLKVRENGLWTLRTKNGPFCTKIWSSGGEAPREKNFLLEK